MDTMRVPSRAPRVVNKIGRVTLGKKHGRPTHPGRAKHVEDASSLIFRTVGEVAHADAVTGAFPDTM